MNDLVQTIETRAILLEEAVDALQLLYETVEHEGIIRRGENGELRSILLINRLPMFLSAYNIILRDLRHHVDELDKAVIEHYKKRKSENR